MSLIRVVQLFHGTDVSHLDFSPLIHVFFVQPFHRKSIIYSSFVHPFIAIVKVRTICQVEYPHDQAFPSTNMSDTVIRGTPNTPKRD
jgi:hypothetical protein